MSIIFLFLAVLLLWLAQIACFVTLVVEMFKNDESGWAIGLIILFFCGCGQLFGLIYGWTKVGEWDISLLMLAYSLSIVLGIIEGVLWMAKLGPSLGM